MDRLVKFSFGLLKVSSLGLVVVYLIAAITVGAAGHGSGDSVSLFSIFGYSVILAYFLFKFQKRPSRSGRTVLLILLIPVVAVLLYFIFMILYELFRGKFGLIEVELLIVLVLISFVASSVVVVKALLTWSPNSKAIDATK
jgi:hypothetical protein